jgi:hypothetical protein
MKRFVLVISFALSACSNANKVTSTANVATISPSTSVRIKCINQDFSDKSNLPQYENKFIVVPYHKLKTPGKARQEKDIDQTERLYFERVSKMAEKALTEAGLKKAKLSDKDALIVGLGWNTKKRKLGWQEIAAFKSVGKANGNIQNLPNGEIYLSHLRLKAVAANKKNTRWEVDLESINSDTFYLNALPPLFVAAKAFVGKNCNSIAEMSIQNDSPEIAAFKKMENQ